MNYLTEKQDFIRLFRRLKPWAQRVLALCLALSICFGFLLAPAAAEDIHPPAGNQEPSSSEAEPDPGSSEAPASGSSEPAIIGAPDTPPSSGGSEGAPDPSSTHASEFPVTPSSEEVPEPTQPEPALVTAEATVTNHSAQPVSAGTPVTKTYIFEVSTGTVKGGGCAENVEYFVIYYTAEGKSRSAVIFPNNDGISRSVERASVYGTRAQRRQDVRNVFGYEVQDPGKLAGLRSVKTDQFLFTTPYQITRIDQIQIFGKKTDVMSEDGNSFSDASTWACQGMRLYEVTKLYGEDMYGWYSEEGYIDFDGHIIADVDMSSGGGTFRWNSSGGVFNILPPGSRNGVNGCKLINTENYSGYSGNTHVGENHSSQSSSQIIFRFDLADLGGAGFESLAGSYSAGSHTRISTQSFCETAALSIRYEDVFGCLRDVDFPLIISSLGWTMEQLGDVEICGYAQQGDRLAFSAMLPDFASLSSAKIVIGESEAAQKAHLTSTDAANGNSLRNSRCSASETDDITYLCIAAYDAASVSLKLEGATLRYDFYPGGENPIRYYNAGSVYGSTIGAGSSLTFSLGNYHKNMVLTPIDRTEKYLITFCTDNVDNSGTNSNIYLQFKFINMKDKEVTSGEFNLRDYVRQFYGEWPGNTSDFAYQYGLRDGGTVQAMIPLANVKQFKSVSIRIEGNDEWQFKGLTMQMVKSYDSRVLRWDEIDDHGFKSHVRITRSVAAQKVCFSTGTVYDENHPILDPDDPNWTPGTLIQDDNMYHEYNGQGDEVDARDEIDWESLRVFMTYEDTLQELGFIKQRCMYEVEVNVAGNKVNDDDDDCGSENLFYFQLVFDNGKSGCVLANRQLQADSFRTGEPARFYIPTAQDYGDLHSIRIIPDDQDDNSHIYDKLKISSITVRKQNVGKISPVWTADSDSKDGLGWVGIDPRDSGTAGSYRGAEGRTILELAHSYNITKSTYSTKLLFCITTGDYASTTATGRNGVTATINDPNLIAGMSMSLSYKKQDGMTKDIAPFDIVKLMNQYSGIKDNTSFVLDGESTEVNFCVSDPAYQFRPGKTDSFFVDVEDIKELYSAQLQIKSSVVTKWNITGISVYQVQSSGKRYINKNGEYDFEYPPGEGLIYKCSWNFDENLVKDVQIYRTHEKDSIATVDLHFTENEFEAYGGENWTSTVTREPPSKDDMLNLFIYPSTESAASDYNSYKLYSTVLYTDTLYRQPLDVSTGSMLRTLSSSGQPCFYALGLNANYLDSISGVNVFTQSEKPVHAPMSYGILQRVRSGVLIDSYYLTGAGNADAGLTMHISQDPSGRNIQRLFVQFSEEMNEQILIPEEKDLALALYFTTDDAYGGELRSKYVTLTDQGIEEIKPGQVVELDFSIYNLKEVTGLAIVNMGRLEDTIENIVVFDQKTNGMIQNKWSFRRGYEPIVPSHVPGRADPYGDVMLLDLDITTAPNNGSYNSGTTGPVKLTVGFYTREGAEATYVFDDIRNFADSPYPFRSDQTDHVRVLVPDAMTIRWVQLEPFNGDDGLNAIWKLDKITSTTDLSSQPLTRILETNNVCRPGEPLKVSLAEVMLGGLLSIIENPNDSGTPNGDYIIPTGGSLELSLEVGQGVNIVPRVEGSNAGLDIKLNRVDSSGGLLQANLVDTRGYTQRMINENRASAEQKGNTYEAAFWESVQVDDGFWKRMPENDDMAPVDYIRFIPPHNYTSSVIYYRITITSLENEAATVYINLIVPSEPDPLPDLLEEARARDRGESVGHKHDMLTINRVEPTCMQEGNILYYSCAGCQKYFSDPLGNNEIVDLEQTVLPAKGHDWGEWITTQEPTCTAVGYRTRSCNRSGCDAVERQTIPATGHSWSGWTSNDNGTHTRTCTICGIPDTANCAYQDTVTPPTDTEQGYTTHTCSVCGYSYRDHYTNPTPETPTDPTGPDDFSPIDAAAVPRTKEDDQCLMN